MFYSPSIMLICYYPVVFVLFQSLVQLFDTPAGNYIPEAQLAQWHAADVLFEDSHGEPAPLQTTPYAISVNAAAVQGLVQFIIALDISSPQNVQAGNGKSRASGHVATAAKRPRFGGE